MSLSGFRRRLSVAPLAGVERQGVDPWVVEVLRWGYRVTFLSEPPLTAEPIPFPSHSPTSIRGKALEKEVQSLVEK